MVDVSVIIPCRNQGDTLERAVNSAVSLGIKNIIVFNDNDRTLKPPKTVKQIFKPFHVGVIYARNCLIQESETSWIIPLDADDELICIPPIPDNPNEFVYGGWIEHYADGSEQTFEANAPKMLRQKPLCHATMLFSKAQWQAVGGYDPDFFFGEDYGFQCALMAAGYIPKRLDYPVYKRYVGKNERTERAKKYWPVIQDLAREKYPGIFS